MEMFNNLFQECSDLFLSGGADKLARENGLRFLGKIPIDQVLQDAEESLYLH